MNRKVGLKFSAMILALGSVFLSPIGAHAQVDNPDTYPLRPVRLIIPFPPGGPTDVLGRLVGEILGKELSQPFVAVNVSGAGGTIGAIQVARSKPDGYTLMLGTAGTIINNPHMNKKIGYDPLKDFQAISSLWSQPSVVLVRKDGPFGNLKELIAEAKRRPGALNYGSSGIGAFNHLSAEFFASLAGIKMTHVPYKGVAPAITDLIAKNLDVVFGPVTNLLSNSDRLIGLAVSAPTRSSFAPAVPTSAEGGLPDFVYSSWGGLFAPAGISPRIAEKLSSAIARGSSAESVRKRYTVLGVDSEFSSPGEYQAYIAAEFKRGGQLIETIGLKEEK
ncbi:MAG: tripartite tricarboxylate transporter substrate binding protein [Betaproteobacteria bacterium]|nr:tripartite tricarboxylate transporter substrate binding protein [Betaproteobacteria bacterium]